MQIESMDLLPFLIILENYNSKKLHGQYKTNIADAKKSENDKTFPNIFLLVISHTGYIKLITTLK